MKTKALVFLVALFLCGCEEGPLRFICDGTFKDAQGDPDHPRIFQFSQPRAVKIVIELGEGRLSQIGAKTFGSAACKKENDSGELICKEENNAPQSSSFEKTSYFFILNKYTGRLGMLSNNYIKDMKDKSFAFSFEGYCQKYESTLF